MNLEKKIKGKMIMLNDSLKILSEWPKLRRKKNTEIILKGRKNIPIHGATKDDSKTVEDRGEDQNGMHNSKHSCFWLAAKLEIDEAKVSVVAL